MVDIDCINKLEDIIWNFIQEDISYLGGMIVQNENWSKEEITRSYTMAEEDLRWINDIREFTEINGLSDSAIELIETFIHSLKTGNLVDTKELISSTPLVGAIRTRGIEKLPIPHEVIFHPYPERVMHIIKEFLKNL